MQWVHTDAGFKYFRYMIQEDRDGPLISMGVKEFVMTVGARSPSPGGGSVAALTATLVSHIIIVPLSGVTWSLSLPLLVVSLW